MNLYLASYLLCIGFKKMFRKLLKILNQQDPNFFCLFYWSYGWRTTSHVFAVFRRWRTKLMRRENGTKLKYLTFDLNLLLASTRALQVYVDAPMVTRPFSSVIGMSPIGGFKNRVFFIIIILFLEPTLAHKFLVAANS